MLWWRVALGKTGARHVPCSDVGVAGGAGGRARQKDKQPSFRRLLGEFDSMNPFFLGLLLLVLVEIVAGEPLLEALDAAEGVDEGLLTREERVRA